MTTTLCRRQESKVITTKPPKTEDPYHVEKLDKVLKELFPDNSYRIGFNFGCKDLEIVIVGVKK